MESGHFQPHFGNRTDDVSFIIRKLDELQIYFINTIIDYLNIIGVIQPAALFEPPLTDIASNGLIGAFSEKEAAEIVTMIERINHNSVAI